MAHWRKLWACSASEQQIGKAPEQRRPGALGALLLQLTGEGTAAAAATQGRTRDHMAAADDTKWKYVKESHEQENFT